MIEKSVGEDFRAFSPFTAARATALELRRPDELHIFVSLPLVFLRSVDAGEKHRLHPHLGKQFCIGCGVSKRVQLPAHFWNDTKLLLEGNQNEAI